jgi:ribose transport system ATP-binding protein
MPVGEVGPEAAQVRSEIMEIPVLRLEKVWKHFDGVAAAKGVTFEARGGEIHALLGENGAGKSTLMAIAAGSLRPDAGTVQVGGQVLGALTPLGARQLGLSIVYQQPALVPDLTVYENFAMAIGDRMKQMGRSAGPWAIAQLERVGCNAPLQARVGELSVVQRQLLEIAKAIAASPRTLVLDEPTAALGADDTARLFAELRAIAAQGTAVVYITHRLAEVRELCHRVTVIRDGEVRGSFQVEEVTDAQILELIVGRSVESEFPAKAPAKTTGRCVLAVKHLTGGNFHEVTIEAADGEIVGIGGIVGNGQESFLRALAGLEPATGHVELNGMPVKLGDPRAALDAGIVYLSADRLNEGLFPALSVRENASVSSLEEFTRLGYVRGRAEAHAVGVQRIALGIRAPSIEANVLSLSGGNQQKVLVSRVLVNSNAKLVLAQEPTQGVDVGARVEIYRILRTVAASGVGVIVVSSDVRELEGLCDRVLVFSAGRAVAELAGEAISEGAITHAMLTSTARREERERQLARPLSALGRASRALARLGRSDFAAPGVLLVAVVGIALYTQSVNSRYLSSFNLTSLTVLVAALAFVSFGQATVMMTGGIDLSVGPLAGLVVVVGSFFETSGQPFAVMAAGFVVIVAVAAGVGLLNGAMVQGARFTPIAATLVTYIALQGVSLVLRPFQAGFIITSVINGIQQNIGPVAIAFVAAAALAAGLEVALKRSWWGVHLRAIGSKADAAYRLGVRPKVTVVGAYVACSVLTCLGGVLLMAQVGVGDPTQGVNYTLASVTAVVLGGTSIFGGRGSFLGAFFGAVLVEQLLNVTTFLQLTQAWQYWFESILVFVAVGVYTQARRRREGHVAGRWAALLRMGARSGATGVVP